MNIIPRYAANTLLNLAKSYPALVVTGPRQSGKTTLVKDVFPKKTYVSLEEIDTREFATEDPRGFLNQYPDGAILDEVQRCPNLFSYLQSRLDADKTMGQFILTGSQQLGLLTGVTQSLAGRVANFSLMPFCLGELQQVDEAPKTVEELLFKGLYPAIYDRKLNPSIWYSNYVNTYIERDVRQMTRINDLSIFQRFVRMCAARTGQILNLSSLAGDCGITHNTAKSWISLLEASYIVHLLRPHHKNFNKRLIKAPKLYFYDSGLAAWLLGIQTESQLATHSAKGQLFETWVVSELLKYRYNQSLNSNLYFWRDSKGAEVDIIIEKADALLAIEIKSGQTIVSDFFKGLNNYANSAGSQLTEKVLIYGGEQSQLRNDTKVIPWKAINLL